MTSDDGSRATGSGCLHAPHSGILMHWNPDMQVGLGSYDAMALLFSTFQHESRKNTRNAMLCYVVNMPWNCTGVMELLSLRSTCMLQLWWICSIFSVLHCGVWSPAD